MSREFAITNGELLAAKYQLKADLMPSRMRALTRDTGDYIVDAARGFLAQHNRTTRLSRGIHRYGVVRTGPDTWTARVGVRGASARYASFVDRGTGMHIDPRVGTPHLIYPRTATVMTWTERGRFATPYQGKGIASYKIRGGASPRWRVVARFTRGQKPVHFMENAFKMADRMYVPARLSVLGLELTR